MLVGARRVARTAVVRVVRGVGLAAGRAGAIAVAGVAVPDALAVAAATSGCMVRAARRTAATAVRRCRERRLAAVLGRRFVVAVAPARIAGATEDLAGARFAGRGRVRLR